MSKFPTPESLKFVILWLMNNGDSSFGVQEMAHILDAYKEQNIPIVVEPKPVEELPLVNMGFKSHPLLPIIS